MNESSTLSVDVPEKTVKPELLQQGEGKGNT
jgi:hypothetical protein